VEYIPYIREKTCTVSVDRALTVVIGIGYLSFLFSSVFSRRDWPDTIAYGLPGANFVLHGALNVPQLGSQFAFDRYWLFNAPMLVVGCIPAFWLAGVGRVPFLLGVVAIGLINLAVCAFICRRLLRLPSAALSVLLALAFLHTRGMVTADLYNQRYAAGAFALLMLAFMPLGERRWWQWLAASLLPLVHLVLAPAAVVWFLFAASDWYRDRPALAGPIAFACGAAANLAWYGRIAAFRTQLWPHMTYGGFRLKGPLSGFFEAAASPIASIPSWALNTAIVAAAMAIVTLSLTSGVFRRLFAPSLPAAVVIVALLPIDLLRGYLYYTYLLIGLGPVLLAAATTDRLRRVALGGLGLMTLANLAVASRLDREHADWTTTSSAEAFLIEHTQPSDRLVLGPPFVFASATVGPARDVRRMIPQPYFLETFDSEAWMRDLNACCDAYLGEEEWYSEQVSRRPPGAPLFRDASIERLEFRGKPVILARRRQPSRQ
jgi:hypothetical protein